MANFQISKFYIGSELTYSYVWHGATGGTKDRVP